MSLGTQICYLAFFSSDCCILAITLHKVALLVRLPLDNQVLEMLPVEHMLPNPLLT